MKKLIYLILISFCLFSPLQAQDVLLPFLKVFSHLSADSIHCRVLYVDSVIVGVVITDYSYLSADSIITASFTVWDTTTGFKFVDFQGVQRKAFIDSLGVRELTVTDSAYIDTLTTAILRVIGKTVVEDSFRVNKTSRFIGSSTFGATATPVVISMGGKVTAADTIRTNTGLKVGNPTVADQQNISIILTADADTDAGGTTKEQLTITSSGNATSTNQKWAFTGTQGSGYSFDKHIYMAIGKEIGLNPTSTGSIRFNDGGFGGGIINLNTSTAIGAFNAVSGLLFANTTITSKSSGTASQYVLNIPYTINLDAAVSSGTMYGIFTNATETNLRGLSHYLMALQVGSVTQFRVTNAGTGYFAGNLGIGTTAPVKKLHVKGDVAIGDTATATNERFLYFAGDGNTTQHNVKHINTGTGFSGFYFSDSISADGYIDYCEYYEGNALNAVASVKKELGSSSKQGFAKLDHNSLPTGVRTTFDLSYWKRKSDSFRMHDGFKPVMSIDPVWIVTPDTSYWQQPTDEDKINYVGNFDMVKEPKPGRNISRMVSLLTKAVQELQAENTLLKERLDKLEKP